MIVYTPDLLTFVIMLVVGAINLGLLAVTIRLVLGQLSATRAHRVCRLLSELVDPIPQWVDRRVTRWRGRPCPPWVSWAIVIVASLIIRQLLVSAVLTIA